MTDFDSIYSDKYKMSYNDLTDYLSDFHKAVFGYRLRCYGDPLDVVEAHLDSVYAYMDRMKETFEGRQELRDDGWVIEEEDPELQAKADEAQRLRDLWNAERDRQYDEELRAVHEEQDPTIRWIDDMYQVQEELESKGARFTRLGDVL